MVQRIPEKTIETYARTIVNEARKYGFETADIIRLVNALIDHSTSPSMDGVGEASAVAHYSGELNVESFPLTSARLSIRPASESRDAELLERWLNDTYGAHFLLSSATAQKLDVHSLLNNGANRVGIVELRDGGPIGAVAYLDLDDDQQRAELRKLIGEKSARGQGFAEEATCLWVRYGFDVLGLEKVYVSTLQTHIRNIQLNEAVGFQVEGILRKEVRLGSERHDVLRMGLCEEY